MSKRRKNKIIELFGLPGSGKTTLSKILTEGGSKEIVQVEVKNKIFRIFYFALFFILNPRFVYFSFLYIRRCNRVVRSYVLHLFTLSCSKLMKAKIESIFSYKIFLIDEGLFQRYLSILETEETDKNIKKYINFFPNWVGLVLVLDGGNFDRFTSLVDAHNNPRVIAGSEYLNKWIVSQKSNYMKVKSIIKEKNPEIFLEIDNSLRKPFDYIKIVEDIDSKL